MPNLNTMYDLESKKRTLALETSTVDILVDLPLGDLSPKKKSEDGEAKVISIALKSNVDDYPDGGLVAWLVVVGVRPPINSVLQDLLMTFHSCRLHVPSLRRRYHSTSFAHRHHLI